MYVYDDSDDNQPPLSPAKMKKMLHTDPNFQDEMKNVLDQLEKMPGLRAKVFKDVGQMATKFNE